MIGPGKGHASGKASEKASEHGAVIQRIVTIGADITEIVADLDGLSRIVGCDRSSRRPPQVIERATLGYSRNVSVEGILSLNPDLVIASASIGPDGVIDKMTNAGLRVVSIHDEPSIAGINLKITKVAALIGRDSSAQSLIAGIARVEADLARRLKAAKRKPRLLFVVAADAGSVMAAGDIETISAALTLAGCDNAGKSWKNVKPVSREAFAANPPDGIVTTPDVLAKNGGAEGLLKITGFDVALTPASILAIDAGPFMLFGPSTPVIARDVAQHFLPELFKGEPG